MKSKKQSQKQGAQTKATPKRAGNLSLQPLDFDQALALMLNTPPPRKPAKKKSETTKKRVKRGSQ